MKLNKKAAGSTELSLIVFGLIFMLLLNISLGFIIDSSLINNYDVESTISGYINESMDLGIILSSAVTGLLWFVDLFFSVFGVNFIAVITILPLWMTTVLVLYNSLITFAIIMYLVDRIWIGQRMKTYINIKHYNINMRKI